MACAQSHAPKEFHVGLPPFASHYASKLLNDQTRKYSGAQIMIEGPNDS